MPAPRLRSRQASSPRAKRPPAPARLVAVPTRTDLSTVEQEWYLLHATRSPPMHAQRLRWAVAMCWQAYVQGRVESLRKNLRLHMDQDYLQAGIMGVYQAAERYRLNGTWTACVYWGVRTALQQEGRQQQLGGWVPDHRLRLLCRAERVRAANPSRPLSRIADDLGVTLEELSHLLSASAAPLQLQPHGSPDGDLERLLVAEDGTDSRLELSALEAALDDLPEPYRGLLVDRWGLRGLPRCTIRTLAKRYRLQRPTVQAVLNHVQSHLSEVMRPNGRITSPGFHPPTWHVLERLVYEAHTQTFLTWSEVVADYDLDTRREAMLLAGGYAHRSGLPKAVDDDRSRLSTSVRVRNEDCYQLASEGRAWSEVARLAGVDSAAVAARHARTFAHRLRPDSSAG